MSKKSKGIVKKNPREKGAGAGIIVDVTMICSVVGCNMFPVYAVHKERGGFGKNKCSRCGIEEEWEYVTK